MKLPLSIAIELAQQLEPDELREYERLLGLLVPGPAFLWAVVPERHTPRYLTDDPTGVRGKLLQRRLIQRANAWSNSLILVRLPTEGMVIT